MVRIAPQPIRFRVSEEAGALCVVIPVKTNWLAFIFLTVWLCGWAVAEVVVSAGFIGAWGQLQLDGVTIFMVFWFICWTAGGGVAFCIWLWNLVGQEVILLQESTLSVRREIKGIGRSREFDLAYARDFRVPPQLSDAYARWWRCGPLPLRGGSVAFDYGARTYHFGSGLDEAEAKLLLEALRPDLPPPAAAQPT